MVSLLGIFVSAGARSRNIRTNSSFGVDAFGLLFWFVAPFSAEGSIVQAARVWNVAGGILNTTGSFDIAARHS